MAKETTDTLDGPSEPMRWTQIARVSIAFLRLPYHRDNMLATMDAASLLMRAAEQLDANKISVS